MGRLATDEPARSRTKVNTKLVNKGTATTRVDRERESFKERELHQQQESLERRQKQGMSIGATGKDT